MTEFKVGDRVRFVNLDSFTTREREQLKNAVGTIIEKTNLYFRVKYDQPTRLGGSVYESNLFHSTELERAFNAADWPENHEYYLFCAPPSGRAQRFPRETVLFLLEEGYIVHKYDRNFGDICHYFERA
jgi:hypothetical protein